MLVTSPSFVLGMWRASGEEYRLPQNQE